MFTGIIESVGVLKDVISNGSNKSFWVESAISNLLNPDQSVSHNGVCLTVEAVTENRHKVTAIKETLSKSNLGKWNQGTVINLERCVAVGQRLDGHIVQGHVDATGICTKRKEKNGSWEFEFEFPKKFARLLVEKGSIAVNGISLTVFNISKTTFRTAIIPYTFEHTNAKEIEEGDTVNIEFDITGKYILRTLELKK